MQLGRLPTMLAPCAHAGNGTPVAAMRLARCPALPAWAPRWAWRRCSKCTMCAAPMWTSPCAPCCNYCCRAGSAVDRAVLLTRSSSGIAAGGGAAMPWRVAHAAAKVDHWPLCCCRASCHPLASRALLTGYLLLIAQGAAVLCAGRARPNHVYSMLEPLTPAMALCLSKSLLFGALTAASNVWPAWRPRRRPAVSQASARAVLFGLLAIVACRRAVCPAAGAVGRQARLTLTCRMAARWRCRRPADHNANEPANHACRQRRPADRRPGECWRCPA